MTNKLEIAQEIEETRHFDSHTSDIQNSLKVAQTKENHL
jgi:hypothetical protein